MLWSCAICSLIWDQLIDTGLTQIDDRPQSSLKCINFSKQTGCLLFKQTVFFTFLTKQVPLIIGTNKNEGLLIKVNHHPLHLIFVLTILTKLLTILFVLIILPKLFQCCLSRIYVSGLLPARRR